MKCAPQKSIRVSVCEGVYMSGGAYGECKANRGVGGLPREREREADRVCKVSGSACDEIRVLRS